MKDEARARSPSVVAREQDAKPIVERDLPGGNRVMFFYRDERFTLPEPDTRLRRGDEVMIVTHSRSLEALHARWSSLARHRPGPGGA